MLVCSNECWRFWNWSLIKNLRLKFGRYFEAEFWWRYWGLGFVNILKLNLRQKFGQDFDYEVWSRFWRWSLVEILKLKYCLWSWILITLWYDIKHLLWWERSTRCAFGNVYKLWWNLILKSIRKMILVWHRFSPHSFAKNYCKLGLSENLLWFCAQVRF